MPKPEKISEDKARGKNMWETAKGKHQVQGLLLSSSGFLLKTGRLVWMVWIGLFLQILAANHVCWREDMRKFSERLFREVWVEVSRKAFVCPGAFLHLGFNSSSVFVLQVELDSKHTHLIGVKHEGKITFWMWKAIWLWPHKKCKKSFSGDRSY